MKHYPELNIEGIEAFIEDKCEVYPIIQRVSLFKLYSYVKSAKYCLIFNSEKPEESDKLYPYYTELESIVSDGSSWLDNHFAMQVYKNRLQKIPTSKLNEFLLEAVKAHHPPGFRGHEIKVKYVTQLPTHSPSFALFCNYPEHVKEPYKRYIENRIRDHYNFTGVPILIFFRKK